MPRPPKTFPSGERTSRNITLDKLLRRKVAYMARYYGRSANAQIEYELRTGVDSFEEEHGPITVEMLEAFEQEQEAQRAKSKRQDMQK